MSAADVVPLSVTSGEPPETFPSLAAALARVQAEIPHITKENVGTIRSEKASYSYRYADLADVTKKILPMLGKVGLSWTALPTMLPDGRFVLRYSLMHVSGESITGDYPLPDPVSTGPQKVGMAITYARRYALCGATGVAPDKDDDDAAGQEPEPKPTSTMRRKGRTESAAPDGPGAALPTGTPPSNATNGDAGEPAERGVQPRQLAALGATFTQTLGVADVDDGRPVQDRHLLTSAIVGRVVTTWRSLTAAEATRVLKATADAPKDAQERQAWIARGVARGRELFEQAQAAQAEKLLRAELHARPVDESSEAGASGEGGTPDDIADAEEVNGPGSSEAGESD